jgi:hypothetical protein
MHRLHPVMRTKELESLLQAKYGAVGDGLHQKISSVEHRLSALVIRGLRSVASIRNRLAHDPAFTDEKVPADFDRLCDDLLDALKVESVPQSPVAIAKRSLIEHRRAKLPPISRVRIICLPAPIVVRQLARALGVANFVVVADLMRFNQFKNSGDTIDESTAADVCNIHGREFRIAK